MITAAELLAGVTDIDGPPLTITSLSIAQRQRQAGRQSGGDLDLHAARERRQVGDVLLHGVGWDRGDSLDRRLARDDAGQRRAGDRGR